MNQKPFTNEDLPLVSIVIPTFNRLHYLPYAIKSALAQSYQNIEVIVSDDASTADVQGLVTSFSDSRLRYRRNVSNIGQALNNLAAFKEAKGKYVANLHDDDIWEPTFLEKLIPPLESNDDAVLAFSNHFIMDSDGNINEEITQQIEAQYKRQTLKPGFHRPFCRMGLVDLSIPLAMASVYKKDAIDWNDFPAEVNSFYDRWLTYLACRTGMAAYYHPERLTRYRVHSTSATAIGGLDISTSSVACHDRFVQDERLKELWPDLRRLRGSSYTKLGIIQLQAGEARRGRRNLLIGMKDRPSLRAAGAIYLTLLPLSLVRRVLRKL